MLRLFSIVHVVLGRVIPDNARCEDYYQQFLRVIDDGNDEAYNFEPALACQRLATNCKYLVHAFSLLEYIPAEGSTRASWDGLVQELVHDVKKPQNIGYNALDMQYSTWNLLSWELIQLNAEWSDIQMLPVFQALSILSKSVREEVGRTRPDFLSGWDSAKGSFGDYDCGVNDLKMSEDWVERLGELKECHQGESHIAILPRLLLSERDVFGNIARMLQAAYS